ncbi:siphovirus Gp157 family protein [Leuconostoc citreum]|nr:siphovirus Gp157 family protein [Leuconostoc citreum]
MAGGVGMTNLYDLTANWQKVYNMEEIDEEAWFDTLSSIDEAIEDKGNNIAKLVRSLESDAEAYKAEAEHFTAKRKVTENKITRLKEYLKGSMELLDKPKFKTELFSFGIQNNPASVEIDDPGRLKEEYPVIAGAEYQEKVYRGFKEALSEEKKHLKNRLKAGEEINGAHIKQTRSLRIR